MRRGISLVELLVAVVIVTLVSTAAANAFIAGLRFQSKSERVMDETTDRVRLEDHMRELIESADLHGNGSYFISPIPASDSGIGQQAQDSGLGAGSPSLVLTAPATPKIQLLNETGQTFQTLNQKYGPLSDCSEIALSMTPVGDAGDRTGLFLREQAPADSDPTQGGEESLLSPAVQDIRFEFYDGTTWAATWDSRSANKGKLPAAVRITYALPNDPQTHSLIVRLPLTDPAPGATQ